MKLHPARLLGDSLSLAQLLDHVLVVAVPLALPGDEVLQPPPLRWERLGSVQGWARDLAVQNPPRHQKLLQDNGATVLLLDHRGESSMLVPFGLPARQSSDECGYNIYTYIWRFLILTSTPPREIRDRKKSESTAKKAIWPQNGLPELRFRSFGQISKSRDETDRLRQVSGDFEPIYKKK